MTEISDVSQHQGVLVVAGRPGVGPSAPGAGEGAECVAHRSARFPRGRGAGRTGHRDLREVRLRPLRPRGAGRPPRWGACCSHVGLGGVGSRAGAGWSQEAAALRALLETGCSCRRLPRTWPVVPSGALCSPRAPTGPGRGRLPGRLPALQPAATAQAPFASRAPRRLRGSRRHPLTLQQSLAVDSGRDLSLTSRPHVPGHPSPITPAPCRRLPLRTTHGHAGR